MMLPGRQYASFMGGEQADYVGRCIVIAPDYEGYGVTKDVPHPYLSQRVTAQQMIDGVKYGLQLYKKDDHDAMDILFHSSWALKDVEDYLEKLWNTGLFDYYETWDGNRGSD